MNTTTTASAAAGPRTASPPSCTCDVPPAAVSEALRLLTCPRGTHVHASWQLMEGHCSPGCKPVLYPQAQVPFSRQWSYFCLIPSCPPVFSFFFLNNAAPPEISPLPLHAPFPI